MRMIDRPLHLAVAGILGLAFVGHSSGVPTAVAESAQHSHGSTDVGHVMPPPVLVDGAKEPERVPDDIAYYHFIKNASVLRSASREERARRDAFVHQARLSDTDRAALLAALTDVRQELDEISEARRAIASGSASVTDGLLASGLQARERFALDAARSRIELNLTEEGSQRLAEHIREYIKRRIVIYGEPAQ